jgi:uroporphyrinogen-III decarboxylase
MRGSMIDMFRQPEKLMAACERLLPQRIAGGAAALKSPRGNPKRVFMPLHRGAESFMSRKQFETFYWPHLKQVMLELVKLGLVPMPFFEGRFDSRLEYLLELPKGSIVCHFEHTDMIRAKEILGDHLCIMGNVPSPLLQVASPSEVEDYCRNLIEKCGKGGGFILTSGSSIDEAKPKNIKAMVDSAKKYGVR